MRNLKFRVWDNVDYMSTPFDLNDLQDGTIKFTDECKVMQFTGLKDRKGVDIYEGDIVHYKGTRGNSCRSVVVYDGTMFTLKNNISRIMDRAVLRIVAVIGNIYENKGLLR